MTTLDTFSQRLRFLADWLEKNVKKESLFTHAWRSRNECGTAYCAGGYAATIPEFNQLGFVWNAGKIVEPFYDNYHGLDACKMFFGASEPFGISSYFENGNENFENVKKNFTLKNVIAKLRVHANLLEEEI